MQQRATTSRPRSVRPDAGPATARCACGAPLRGPGAECSACGRRSASPGLAQLPLGAPDDRAEREADRVARETIHHDAGTPPVRVVEKPPSPRADVAPAAVGMPASGGRPLDPTARAYFEPRFGHDLGHIRIHDGAEASAGARALRARAYTIGSHLMFRTGAPDAGATAGRALLAHELAHSLQQRASLAVQRAPDDQPAAGTAPADPLCASFDLEAVRKDAAAQAQHLGANKDPLPLVRCLKRIRRCATADQQTQVRDELGKIADAASVSAAWDAAGTAFGGYTGFYPGYAPDIKTHLTKLGASETLAATSFELSAEGAKHRSRAKTSAAGEVADLGRTDIVYFRGHQFAQYRAPGLFSNGDETRGFDLRYVEKAGGFGNVKLMISTSCATLCKEAVEVFTSLFPNAVILGYRKSAPIEGGAVRSDLTTRINALNRPLLIDEPVDVAAIIDTWKSVIESRHKGETAPVPGYLQGGTVHYWDGTAWHSTPATDPANACKRKGDFSGQYPAPPPP